MLFQSEFVLNREHFAECFDQSALLKVKRAPRYKLMVALVLVGLLIVVFAAQQKTLGFFLIALAFLEYFSFRYRRAWWLTRQMWSRNSNNTISLNIDDNGVKIESLYNNNQLLWSDIGKVIETPDGLMLELKSGGQNYLSKRSLDQKCIEFIKSQTLSTEIS
jgi:hypothetical protein